MSQLISFSCIVKNFEHNIGVNVKEMINETNIPAVTTTANDSKKRPIIPSINITGAKIQTKANEDARTAKTTSLLPLIAALNIFLSIFF